MADLPLLTLVLIAPAVTTLVIAFLPRERGPTVRMTAMVGATVTFVLSLLVLAAFEVGEGGFQLIDSVPWIDAWGVRYTVGVDGITLPLLLLSTFIIPLAILATWNDVEDRVKGFYIAVMALEVAIIGVFIALDLVLFYVFFEAMLVPMYVLIGIWGGARRRYAAIKFFLYTFVGGLLMLVAIIFLHLQTDPGTFDYRTILELELTNTQQTWLFLAFMVAFAIKVPVFPFHTWLPDAHTEAPTIGSVDLAALLLKIGGYGMIRFVLPFFPDATGTFAYSIAILAVIGIVYGAIVAMMQPDIKRLVAYSSVSHMGFVVLGLFAVNTIATSGSVVQMINHGLSTGALFILIGFMYQRTHSRMISEYSGTASTAPVLGGLFLVVALSSMALPGLNGFVGEFPILLGSFQTFRWPAVVGALGMVLAALYLLWAYQRMFHGKVAGFAEGLKDLSAREIAVMVPLVAVIVGIGIFPDPLYDRIEPSVERLIEQVEGGEAVEAAELETVETPAPLEARDLSRLIR